MTFFDISLTTIFAIEAGVKIIAYGFAFCGSTSYIRNWWNVLDFFVVFLTVIFIA